MKKAHVGLIQQDNAVVHACPHQGTGPMQHACCIHDEGNGSGTVGCVVPLMESVNRKAPP